MISIEIDGKTIEVEPGTTVLQAAQQLGIDIPHLCYDPNLPPTSSCRLCIVEVEGAKSFSASCSLPVSDGMVVRTQTPELVEARRTIIELLLSNHPLDCLTCEKSGDCKLQDYAYQLGVKSSSFEGERFEFEPIIDNPAICVDHGKCILCGRCVTVCHEIQVTGAIDFVGRGFPTRVDLPMFKNRLESDCNLCGNCVQFCPVGALTDVKAQGTGREWEMEKVDTICPYCGVGCTLRMSTRDNTVVKIASAPGVGVNKGFLCVKGKFGYDFLDHTDRLTTPLVKKDGTFHEATWDEALDLVAKRFTELKKKHGAEAIAGLSSAKTTNEENYLMQKFVRAVFGTNNVDHCARLCHASTVAGLARAFGSGAMTNSIDEIEEADAIFVIGSNTTECHPVIGAAIKRAATQRGATLIVADPRNIELTEYAAVHMRQRSGTDVALINAMMNVILEENIEDKEFVASRTEGFDEFSEVVKKYPPEMAEKITGVPADDIREAARLYATAGAASIIYSMGITQHTTGTDNVLSLANLAMVTGNIGRESTGVNPLRGQNNVQGACDLGALPNVYPGYQKVDDPDVHDKFEKAWGATLSDKVGITVVEMMNAAAEGSIKGLYIMGENPMLSDPDVNHVREGLETLDFFVVQDIFLTETAQLADVVLPAASFAEKDGTFTNTERRVQLLRQVIDPPGESQADWRILCEVARRMGYEMSYESTAGIQDEIASLTPIYGGITHDRLEDGGLQWPCPDKDHPGTKFLHKGKFSRGLGKFHPVEFIPAAELPDDDYPIVLSTGRVLQHWHTGTMTRRAEVLDTLVPHCVVEMNPQEAEQYGVEDGEEVVVASRRGEITLKAKVTDRVMPGALFIPFHFHESPANILTIAALDPIAKIPEFKVCAVKLRKA